jgi:hypothetical protein
MHSGTPFIGPVCPPGSDQRRRLESRDLPESEAMRSLLPDRLYLGAADDSGGVGLWQLHPLLLRETESGRVLFLNSHRGRQRTDYLCYTTGDVFERSDLGAEHRALLARVLQTPGDETRLAEWAALSRSGEPEAQLLAGGVATAGGVRATERVGPGRYGRGLPRLAAVAWPPSGREEPISNS